MNQNNNKPADVATHPNFERLKNFLVEQDAWDKYVANYVAYHKKPIVIAEIEEVLTKGERLSFSHIDVSFDWRNSHEGLEYWDDLDDKYAYFIVHKQHHYEQTWRDIQSVYVGEFVERK